jgi:hypothetical protein
MSRGALWLKSIDRLWIILPALLIGTVKSIFMLDKSAKKSIDRIIATRDGMCLGGVYSIRTWLLVLVMMVAGYLMRTSQLPITFLGLFYVSIGWGLLFSSRNAWGAWRHGDVPEKDSEKSKYL